MDWTRCSRDEALAWLRVCLVPGVQPAALRALLAWRGSPARLLDAPSREVAAVGGREAAEALARGADRARVDATMRWLDAPNRHLVALGDALYPPALLQIGDPPPVLYAEGRLELLAAPALAIVGSRNATSQGVRDAEALARALSSAGLAVVSGLAMGIDAAAHRGGLAEAGSSIAIMGTGPDIHYPSANRNLARMLASQGCLLSEFPLGSPPLPGNFPRRNRLISGMSKGVLVVEAGLPSGSLTTARLALEQGRDVFAMPGSIHAPLSKGCHWLIKQGAKLVEGADDVLDELGWSAPERSTPARANAVPGEQPDALLQALGFAPATLEQLAARTGLDAPRLAARLTMLELDGSVCALPGGAFQRVAPQ